MSLDRAARERLVRALAASMIEHAEELTSRPGNRRRRSRIEHEAGFEAVLATLPGLADKSLPEMLKAIGMTLVMKVGGASGPLVGTFFMELGKALPEQPTRRSRRGGGPGDRRCQGARAFGSGAENPAGCSGAGASRICEWGVTPGRLRPRRRKPPIARHRCLQPAAGHPSSAKDPSVIWTRGLARRPS